MTDTIKEPIKHIIKELTWDWNSSIIQTDLLEWWYADNVYHIICDKIEVEDWMIYVILATNKEQNPAFMVRLPSDFLKELYSVYNEDQIRIEISDEDHIFWMFWEDKYADITKWHMAVMREENWQFKIKVGN